MTECSHRAMMFGLNLATSLLGVFLVLRGMAMVTDAISHTILLGIVLAFFITNDIRSPWLIIAASLVGVLTVYIAIILVSNCSTRS